jgi:hypothetical protein
MHKGGANTVVLPRHKRNKTDDLVSLPLFGNIDLHLPEFFVIKMKKGYKLVSPVTKTGAITSRSGKQAFKVVKNEKNELFLHEPSFPQIHPKEFSKKDRAILEKYYHKMPVVHPSSSKSKSSRHSKSYKRSHVESHPSISSLSDKSFDEETDTVLPSGKRKYGVRKSYEVEKAEQKEERNVMASQDTRRISRMARIASKKQGQGRGREKTRRRRF